MGFRNKNSRGKFLLCSDSNSDDDFNRSKKSKGASSDSKYFENSAQHQLQSINQYQKCVAMSPKHPRPTKSQMGQIKHSNSYLNLTF